MYSLFIDTHDKDISLCLYKDGKVLDTNIRSSERNHSDFIMPMIDELLSRNEIEVNSLNEILVINGPGSFTGVRLGVTIAKTLAYVLNIDIKMISSLEMYAVSNESDKDKIVVINDLKGVFGGHFNKDNNIIGELFYKSNDEYKEYITVNNIEGNIIVEKEIDFNKVYEYFKTKETVNPHKVNPIYIKVIEALKDDKTSK